MVLEQLFKTHLDSMLNGLSLVVNTEVQSLQSQAMERLFTSQEEDSSRLSLYQFIQQVINGGKLELTQQKVKFKDEEC